MTQLIVTTIPIVTTPVSVSEEEEDREGGRAEKEHGTEDFMYQEKNFYTSERPEVPSMSEFQFPPLNNDEPELDVDQENLLATKNDIYELKVKLNMLITHIDVVSIIKKEKLVMADQKDMYGVKEKINKKLLELVEDKDYQMQQVNKSLEENNRSVVKQINENISLNRKGSVVEAAPSQQGGEKLIHSSAQTSSIPTSSSQTTTTI
ncbi:hypothetical protein LXL04_020770 [Taraxacum kok-saghyz]